MKRIMVTLGVMLVTASALFGQLADGAKTETGGVLPTLSGANDWTGDNNFTNPPTVEGEPVVVCLCKYWRR